jgi:hypothetical protein
MKEREPFTFSAINDTLLSEEESGLTAATGPAQHIRDYVCLHKANMKKIMFVFTRQT